MQVMKNLKERFLREKKLFVLLALGIAGILLIFGSEMLGNSDAASQEEPAADSQSAYCEALEQKLQTVLSKTEGAGRVEVMVTLESSDEKIYATDEKTNYKSSDTGTERTNDAQYVLQGGDTGIVLKTNAPQVKGVIVVCDGGGDDAVVRQITNAVCASLGVKSNCVSVLKMKSGEE